jgi:hypothetical protein
MVADLVADLAADLATNLAANLGFAFTVEGCVVMVISPDTPAQPASAWVWRLGGIRTIECDEDHRMVESTRSLAIALGRAALSAVAPWRGLPARGVLSRMTRRNAAFLFGEGTNLDQ